MRVQERPDELAADVFQAEFKMRVLVDGVMAAEKGAGADVDALLFGDFFGTDQARGIAGARRGDRGIERMRERVAQRDARRGSFHLRLRIESGKGENLRGHLLANCTPRARRFTSAAKRLRRLQEQTLAAMIR